MVLTGSPKEKPKPILGGPNPTKMTPSELGFAEQLRGICWLNQRHRVESEANLGRELGEREVNDGKFDYCLGGSQPSGSSVVWSLVA